MQRLKEIFLKITTPKNDVSASEETSRQGFEIVNKAEINAVFEVFDLCVPMELLYGKHSAELMGLLELSERQSEGILALRQFAQSMELSLDEKNELSDFLEKKLYVEITDLANRVLDAGIKAAWFGKSGKGDLKVKHIQFLEPFEVLRFWNQDKPSTTLRLLK